MGRMSPLHSPQTGLTQGSSVAPASRNGGASNADVNGSTIDLTGTFTLTVAFLGDT